MLQVIETTTTAPSPRWQHRLTLLPLHLDELVFLGVGLTYLPQLLLPLNALLLPFRELIVQLFHRHLVAGELLLNAVQVHAHVLSFPLFRLQLELLQQRHMFSHNMITRGR